MKQVLASVVAACTFLAGSGHAAAGLVSLDAGATPRAGDAERPFKVPLPDPELTPGATDPTVSQANIQQTICASGYARAIRHVSSATKQRIYAEYRIETSRRGAYQIDYLIPLELGGSSSIENLWPEPERGRNGAHAKNRVENDLHGLVCAGQVQLADVQRAIATDWRASISTTTTNATAPSGTDPVITIAGDIAEGGNETLTNATSTGDLVRSISPTFALTAGDNAYPDGSDSDYAKKYGPTWGSFKANTKPAPGNHEYHSDPPRGYYNYFFGGTATPYYAYDVNAAWRAYSLNSEIDVSAGSDEETWFKNDLAAHPGKHYIAYQHEPRYTSGSTHSDDGDLVQLWTDFRAAQGDIWISAHNHDYERFAKMNANGALDSGGIREFVAGTGGNQLYDFESSPHVGEQFRQNTDFGVLKLTLHPNSYDWQFVASGRGWDGSSSINTPNKGKVLDSGTEATNA